MQILLALTQWAHFDFQHIKPVVKIAAETAIFDFLLQITVGGGHHSHVHIHLFFRTHWAHRALF
ncbi:Uncharacterised protein [Vibrio cholerae]|nr:Uncharacterised protein [Vibrio cholerae]